MEPLCGTKRCGSEQSGSPHLLLSHLWPCRIVACGVASVVMLIILPVVPFVVSQPPPQIYRHPQRNEEMPYPVWSIDRSLSVTLGIQSYELSHQLEAIIERSRSGQMSGDGFILDKDGFFYIHYM